MPDDLPEVKDPPKPDALANHRLPDPVTPSERETFEAKIAEQAAQIEMLLEKIEKLENPPAPKKKSGLERFTPFQ